MRSYAIIAVCVAAALLAAKLRSGDSATAGTFEVSAETRAAFPEARGFVYRTLVVGSGIHARVVRRLLKGLRRRAEWDRRPVSTF